MYGKEVLLLMISTVIKVSHSQYFNQEKMNYNPVNCEDSKDTRLVEHFFNLIFAEFYSTPPLCTCVQICIDHPVYCYPNGCMKTKTKEPFQTHIQKDDKRVTLVIKDRNLAFPSNLFQDLQNINLKKEIPESAVSHDLLPNMLKDRYNKLIKFKRTPKAELRYNLRQHINTMKSGRSRIGYADVSKARWPNRQKIISQKKKVGINKAKVVSSEFGNAPMMYTPSTPTVIKTTNFKRENSEGAMKEISTSNKNSTLKNIYMINNSNQDNHSITYEKKDPIMFDEMYNNTFNDIVISLSNLIDKSNMDGNDKMKRLIDDVYESEIKLEQVSRIADKKAMPSEAGRQVPMG